MKQHRFGGRMRRSAAVLLHALVVAVACDSAVAPVTRERDRSAGLATQQPRAGEPFISYDDELLALNDSIPGFAGVVLGSEGNVEVMLTQSASTTREVWARRFARFARRHGWDRVARNIDDPKVRQARYEAKTLIPALRKFEREFGRFGSSVFSTDYDEAQNRIDVVAASPADSAEVAEYFVRLGLAQSAFVVAVGSPAVSFQTLDDDVPPLRGGMKIHYDPTTDPQINCTVGPPIVWVGQPVFPNRIVALTNSHCTRLPNSVPSPQAMYQNVRFFGNEVADYGGGATISGCPRNTICRYADAAVIEVDTTQWWLNTIANTGSPHSLTSAPYPLTIVDQDTVTSVNYSALPVGTVVRKQGQTTGTTSGPIWATCRNEWNSSVNRTLLCQTLFTAKSGPGDSGSPVYRWWANPPFLGGGAVLEGLMWGGTMRSGAMRTLFSPMSQVRVEFGDFATP